MQATLCPSCRSPLSRLPFTLTRKSTSAHATTAEVDAEMRRHFGAQADLGRWYCRWPLAAEQALLRGVPLAQLRDEYIADARRRRRAEREAVARSFERLAAAVGWLDANFALGSA
jgi:hypothetical protein